MAAYESGRHPFAGAWRAVSPLTAAAPGRHRIEAPLEYSRGPDKTWGYGGLRWLMARRSPSAPSRNSAAYLGLTSGAGGRVVVISPVVTWGSRSRPRWLMALADCNAAEMLGAFDAGIG
jgi:hypothetical protein